MQSAKRMRKGTPKRLSVDPMEEVVAKQLPYVERWLALLEEIKDAEDKREHLLQLQPEDEMFKTFAKDRVDNNIDTRSDGDKSSSSGSDNTSGTDIEDGLQSEEADDEAQSEGADDEAHLHNNDDESQGGDDKKGRDTDEEDEEEDAASKEEEEEEEADDDLDEDSDKYLPTHDRLALHDNSTDPSGEIRARLEIELIVAKWTEYIDETTRRAQKLQAHLEIMKFDTTKFLRDALMVPMCEAQMDDVEDRRERSLVTDELQRKFPVEDPSVAKENFKKHLLQIGAQATMTSEDVDELRAVDILDEGTAPLCNDKLRRADYIQVFDKEMDTKDCADQYDAPAQHYGFGACPIGSYTIPEDLVQKLKPHQVKAVSFIVDRLDQRKGTLLAHAMGLGKTISTLSALYVYARQRRMLGQETHVAVVCPKAVMLQWVSETETWQPDLNAMILSNLNEDTVRRTVTLWHKLGGILVMGHEQFESISTRLDLKQLHGVLVIDEAHVLKSTKHTKLHQAVAESVNRLILLTGTPLQNSLDEYYQLVELVSPGLLADSLTRFQQRFTNPIVNGQWLDSSSRSVRDSTVLMYSLLSLAREAMDDCSGATLSQFLPPKREFCLMHAVDPDPFVSSTCDIAELHRVHAHAMPQKLCLVERLVSGIRRECPSDRIVIFSVKVDHLEKCNKVLPGFLYTGSISSLEQREDIISNFKKTPGSIIYMSTLAGGVGLNLACARRVIIMNSSWNPMDDEQAIARVYRLGQLAEVFVYRLVAEGGLETRVYSQGIMKRSIAAQLSSEKDANRLFKEEEMHAFNLDKQWVPLSKSALATADPVISNDMTSLYKVYDHDAFFKPFETPTEEIKEMALNKRHALERDNAFRLLPDKKVSTPTIFYESDDPEPTLKLVPPWTPVIACDESQASAQGAAGASSSTDQSSLYDVVTRFPVETMSSSRVSVGPAHVSDMPQSLIDSGYGILELELERRTFLDIDDEPTDEPWILVWSERIPRLAAANIKCNEIFLPADTAMTPPSSNKKKRRMRETIVEFRSRFVVKDASTEDVFISGPWSAISAPLRWI